MDSDPWVIPLAEAALCDDQRIGGKAAQLARLHRAGFRIAPGFCVTVAAYEQFLRDTQLQRVIQMELGRKPFEELRWEELWDAALRIRNRFSVAEVPLAVAQSICRAVRTLGTGTPLAVRSSAPGEDSAQRSFAGLHESFLYVVGEEAVLESVRLVWASLWSDAALLYRQELALDPLTSRMAVLIQEMRTEDRSGVAFGRDPRTDQNEHAVIEAVPGPCSGLVDGSVDPDHWLIRRATRQVVTFRPGRREGGAQAEPLLQPQDLESLLLVLDQVEGQLGWCPDVEWTGRGDRLTVLQARPITSVRQDPNDKRPWYLTLRPDKQRLRQLCQRVAEQLIPELRELGDRLAAEDVEGLDDAELADCIEARQALARPLETDLLGRVHPLCPRRAVPGDVLQRRRASAGSLRLRRSAPGGRHAGLAAESIAASPGGAGARVPRAAAGAAAGGPRTVGCERLRVGGMGESTARPRRRSSVPGGFPDAAASVHGCGLWRPPPER